MNRKISKKKLNFRTAYRQMFDPNFCMSENCCFICERDLFCPRKYDSHIGYHKGDESESIPQAKQLRDINPSFNISYKHSVDTNKLTFKITTEKDALIIDAIVIIRPEGHKLMHLIEESEIQCSNEKTYTTSVDCSLFHIGKEQLFFVIYRSFCEAYNRELELYIFFRKENFPLTSNRVPRNIKLVLKRILPQNFPNYAIRNLGKGDYDENDIIASNRTMRHFLADKTLTKSNYVEVLSFLLSIEDHFILANYEQIVLKKITITHLGSDNYSFELFQINKVRQFLGSYDDIVISSLTDIGDYYDEDVFKFNHKQSAPTKYFGLIDDIKGKTVYFSLRGKIQIPVKEEKFNIKFYPCRIPFRYQYEALKRISNTDHILNCLFPTGNQNSHLSNCSLEFFNESVKNNPEQAQAVRNIVNGQNISMPFILFGPPGTGKSTTILESVLQLWKMKTSSKILITSGSNAACDEVAKRLCKIFEEIDCEGFNLLRIYATSSGKKMDNTEEILVETSNYAYGEHFYPGLESIYQYRIIVATLTICGKLVQANISDNYFSHIIIDECAASTESEALVGIAGLMGPNTKLILSGDPKQLGPVLKCTPAQHFGFDISMMERLLNLQCYAVDPDTNSYDKSILAILLRNFRSNAGILAIANKLCYNSQLLAHAKKELTDWVHKWKNLPSKNCPVIFYNVYGQTEREDGGTSSMNSKEVDIVMDFVHDILENGINGRNVEQQEIGIISPYKKQYSEIRKQLDSNGWFKVETGSAETFQGQEKPIIIISTVKSFTRHIGFLDNIKRLNVMLTRAQALMIIVGNALSLQNDSNWLQVLQYFQKKRALTGKYYRVPKEVTSANLNLSPDVCKTRDKSNNNQRRSKSKNPHQTYNVVTESNKTTSHDKTKEFASVANRTSQTGTARTQQKYREKQTKPLGPRESFGTTSRQDNSRRSRHRNTSYLEDISVSNFDASTSTTIEAEPTTSSQHNSGRSYHRNTSCLEDFSAITFEKRTSPTLEEKLTTSSQHNSGTYEEWHKRQSGRSAHHLGSLTSNNNTYEKRTSTTLEAKPRTTTPHVSLQLPQLTLRHSAYLPNRMIFDDSPKPRNTRKCIIL